MNVAQVWPKIKTNSYWVTSSAYNKLKKLFNTISFGLLSTLQNLTESQVTKKVFQLIFFQFEFLNSSIYSNQNYIGINYQHKLPGRWKGKIRLPTKEKKTSDMTTLTQYYLLLQFSFSNYLPNNIQRLIHEVKLGRLFFFRPSQGIY